MVMNAIKSLLKTIDDSKKERYELGYCERCMSMTNHIKIDLIESIYYECTKCKEVKEIVQSKTKHLKLYVGIDGGITGGIVAINEFQQIYLMTTMPTTKVGTRKQYDVKQITKILKLLNNYDVVVCLERALVLPISGKLSIAGTHYCNGIFQGIMTALDIRYKVVHPKIWQKELLSGINIKDTKLRALTWLKNTYPDEQWTATKRSRKAHTGLVDACCLANYCKLLL